MSTRASILALVLRALTVGDLPRTSGEVGMDWWMCSPGERASFMRSNRMARSSGTDTWDTRRDRDSRHLGRGPNRGAWVVVGAATRRVCGAPNGGGGVVVGAATSMCSLADRE